jgi:hypothetical protein
VRLFAQGKSEAAADVIQFTKVLDNIREDRIFLFQVLFQFSQPLADLAFLEHHLRSYLWLVQLPSKVVRFSWHTEP